MEFLTLAMKQLHIRHEPPPLPRRWWGCTGGGGTRGVRGEGTGGYRGGGHGRQGLAVHTQGGAQIRRSMAAAGFLLFKGVGGLAPASSKASRLWSAASSREGLAVHTQGGACTRPCTHKAVHTQGGLWPPQESCYLSGVRGLASASSEVSRLWSAASQRVGAGCQGVDRGAGGGRGGGYKQGTGGHSGGI